LISVVMPVFNEGRLIDQQLDALARQDFSGAWELVIADNGSTDDTRARARSWSDRLPVRVVDASARKGCGPARNVGVAQAVGSALAFCDGDDVVAPGWLSAHVGALETADVIAGSIVPFDGDRPRAGVTVPPAPPTLLGWLPYAQGANCSVRREVYDQVGGFPEQSSHAEDVEFSWLAQLQGYRFVYEPKALVHKRNRQTAGARFRQYVGYGRSDVDLYIRYRTHGAVRAPAASLTRTYLGLVARLPLLRSPDERDRWVRQLGRRTGRLLESGRRRTICL
jgi:glycosyltransferase involved in cell wall biosynthesis